MRVVAALVSGAVGAATLTLVHEVARRMTPSAPRVDILGMRALARTFRLLGQSPPPRKRLFRETLAGDLVSNAAYYSVIGLGDPQKAWRRGIMLGLGAGVGAVVLPKPLGLGTQPQARTPLTALLTVVWYLVGGLAAAAVARRFGSSEG
jgi:hypothetical protein